MVYTNDHGNNFFNQQNMKEFLSELMRHNFVLDLEYGESSKTIRDSIGGIDVSFCVEYNYEKVNEHSSTHDQPEEFDVEFWITSVTDVQVNKEFTENENRVIEEVIINKVIYTN